MKGRRSVWVRTGMLEARVPQRRRWRTDWNLDALSDVELEQLMPLSEAQAAAHAAGNEPDWSTEELTLLERLATKAGAPPHRSPATATGTSR